MGGKLTKIFLPCDITTESPGWKMDSVAADFGPRTWLAVLFGTYWITPYLHHPSYYRCVNFHIWDLPLHPLTGVTFSTGWNRTDTTSHHNCPTKPFEGSAANRGGSPARLYLVGFYNPCKIRYFFCNGTSFTDGIWKDLTSWEVEDQRSR